MMQFRPHRYQTEFPVDLRTASGAQKGQVIDVNTFGARIARLKHLRRGDKVQLEILSRRIEAVVQWASAAEVGIAFKPHITDDQVDTLRYRRDGRGARRHGSVGFAYTEMR